MATIQTVDTPENSSISLAVFLPGWADEAATLPHPAPLVEPVEMALCRELGLALSNNSAIPAAQCLWRAALGQTPTPEHLVCASPVHVIAGSDDAQLITSNRLNLTLDETRSMIRELNDALAENFCSFLHDEAGNWYHQGLPAGSLDAASPASVEGHPMTGAMPRSDDARAWRSLWSESQMVLHQSAANQARQSRGEPLINSVWFWGGGPMPSSKTVDTDNTVLFADDPFACGLADALGVTRQPLAQAQQLDLANTLYRRHVILDTALLHGNPDFIEQRDLGNLWSERVMKLVSNHQHIEAELNGLTGCREAFMLDIAKSRSIFSRLATIFQR